LEDRGAIVFLDYRFSTAYCKNFLPSWITSGMKVLPDKKGVLGVEVSSFFRVQA
jgi:Rad3-related DNA helicase